jgi:hypothetical protein
VLKDEKGTVIADPYRFPMRIGDRTIYLPPEQLSMYMNANERRILLLLRSISGADGGDVDAKIAVFDRRTYEGTVMPRSRRLVGIDEQ